MPDLIQAEVSDAARRQHICRYRLFGRVLDLGTTQRTGKALFCPLTDTHFVELVLPAARQEDDVVGKRSQANRASAPTNAFVKRHLVPVDNSLYHCSMVLSRVRTRVFFRICAPSLR